MYGINNLNDSKLNIFMRSWKHHHQIKADTVSLISVNTTTYCVSGRQFTPVKLSHGAEAAPKAAREDPPRDKDARQATSHTATFCTLV